MLRGHQSEQFLHSFEGTSVAKCPYHLPPLLHPAMYIAMNYKLHPYSMLLLFSLRT